MFKTAGLCAAAASYLWFAVNKRFSEENVVLSKKVKRQVCQVEGIDNKLVKKLLEILPFEYKNQIESPLKELSTLLVATSNPDPPVDPYLQHFVRNAYDVLTSAWMKPPAPVLAPKAVISTPSTMYMRNVSLRISLLLRAVSVKVHSGEALDPVTRNVCDSLNALLSSVSDFLSPHPDSAQFYSPTLYQSVLPLCRSCNFMSPNEEGDATDLWYRFFEQTERKNYKDIVFTPFLFSQAAMQTILKSSNSVAASNAEWLLQCDATTKEMCTLISQSRSAH